MVATAPWEFRSFCYCHLLLLACHPADPAARLMYAVIFNCNTYNYFFYILFVLKRNKYSKKNHFFSVHTILFLVQVFAIMPTSNIYVV